ncbi:PH domain-containing protein [Halodesulfurarchaeum sp.]|uniref:PH domain-containing protein n=1 Tax=Halodesulfurarchaeum sp. TaxID=1980530 RepID=UPI001BC317EE|nr:PH domain-containing protein [Halodesulfurarchaeum sp.]
MPSGQEQNAVVQHDAAPTGIDLLEAETVLQNRHPGWVIWWKHFLGAAVVLLYSVGSGGGTLQWGSLFAGIIVATVAASRNRSRYIVTDKRMIKDVGLFRPERRADHYGNVADIEVSQSYIGNVFGIGTIVVRAANGTETTWRGVPEQQAVAMSIREQL